MTRDYAAISRYNEEQLGKDRKSRMSQVAMYADTAHFVYELLQNADDAGASEIDFLLRPNELVVEHNGTPFTEDNVKAISYFGKGKTDVTAIGRFGLGFKSVFAYTATPSIHSEEDDFELVDLYTLKACARPRDLAPGRTRFVLPFDHVAKNPIYIERGMLKSAAAAYSQIAGKLRQLGGATLLFTSHLREIGWSDGSSTGWYRRFDSAVAEGGRETSIRARDDEDQYFLVFERAIAWPDEGGRPLTRRPVAVALQLDKPLAEQGRVTGPTSQKLWVFFPTDKETHTGIIVQGPFRTTPARDNVPAADEFNQFLIDETAELLRACLAEMRDLGLVNAELLTRLPIDAAEFPPDDFLRPLYTEVRAALRYDQLLPTSTGGYQDAADVKLARGQRLTEIFDDQQLSQLFERDGMQWLEPTITVDRYPALHRYLVGTKRHAWSDDWLVEPLIEGIEVSIEDIAGVTTQEFVELQSDEWFIKFYLYLHESRGGVSRHFMTRPILRLEDGSYAPPWKDNAGTPGAYLPTEGESELPTIKRAIANHPTVRKFLGELGLSTPDLTDEVLDKVLPPYEKPGTHTVDQWKKDFKKILVALGSPDEVKRQRLISKLKAAQWVLCQSAGQEGLLLVKPGVAYVASDELKAYFGGSAGTYFLADGYYTANEIAVLAATCGVAGAPRSTARGADWQGYVSIYSRWGNHRRGLNGFDPDWTVDGLEQALSGKGRSVSPFVWHRIAMPSAHLIEGVVERSNYKTFADAKRERVVSTAGKLLRETEWLSDATGQFRRASELFLADLPTDFDRESAQAKRLSEALGMKQPESVQALETLARGNPRLRGLMERMTHEDLDDATIEKMEKLLPKVEKRTPPGSFKDAVAAIHRSAARAPEDADETGGAAVRNPERYTGKLKEKLQEARNEDSRPRAVTFRLVRERSDTTEAKTFLYHEYEGRCQVSGETFTKANGKNYFEAVTLVPTQGTEYLNNAGNMLCLSADTAARFMHASFEWVDDLGQKIEAFKTEREGGTVEDRQVRVRLGGEERVVTFTERHLLRLKALWESENATKDQA